MNQPLITACAMCDKPMRVGWQLPTALDRIPGVELQKEMMASGLERTYYYCPHCGHKYTVMLTDEEIRELMGERDKLKGFAGIKNKRIREQKQMEFEKLDKEIKEKLNRLYGK